VSNERPYQSALRDEQALQTKLRIRQAARELFTAKGFSSTTIKQIAQAAGVSPATVYAIFDSKAGIVVAMLEDMEENATIRDKLEAIFEQRDTRQQLRMFVAAHCDLFNDSADILRAAMRAIEDPEVAALAVQGDRNRREVIEILTTNWGNMGALRAGLTSSSAADRLWLLTTVEGYLNAVDRLGWKSDEYQDWLVDLIETEVMSPHRKA
jgi:AcrR family transcriptional regulator